MSPKRILEAWPAIAFAFTLATPAPGLAQSSSLPRHQTHVVTYQCPNEPEQTFKFDGGTGEQSEAAKLEAKWYWGRTRKDRGEGCQILTVDGQRVR
jgi:hypothetical protein